MSSRIKIPDDIADPALLFEGNRARVIEKSKAEDMCDLRDDRKPSARRCGSQKVRSNLWSGTRELSAYRVTNFGHTDVLRSNRLSSRMSPRHPQANGDFRRGAYHDLLDAGGNPEALVTWGEQNRRATMKSIPFETFCGPPCETCNGPSVCYRNRKSLCRACAEKDSRFVEGVGQ